MQVKDWMSLSPITAPSSTPVFQARKLMQDHRIRHLPVMEEAELVGIITDRDIRLNLPSPATGLSVWEINYILDKLTVGEVMTKTVITIGASRPIEAAAELMLDHRIGALPVLEGGRLVGILTETDLLRALVRALTGKTVPRHEPGSAEIAAAIERVAPRR